MASACPSSASTLTSSGSAAAASGGASPSARVPPWPPCGWASAFRDGSSRRVIARCSRGCSGGERWAFTHYESDIAFLAAFESSVHRILPYTFRCFLSPLNSSGPLPSPVSRIPPRLVTFPSAIPPHLPRNKSVTHVRTKSAPYLYRPAPIPTPSSQHQLRRHARRDGINVSGGCAGAEGEEGEEAPGGSLHLDLVSLFA